jgi:hypothetical protein
MFNTAGQRLSMAWCGAVNLQIKQGRRDSNPQPLVLETSALPIELHP